MRLWAGGVMASVIICVSGCAASAVAVPAVSAATTSIHTSTSSAAPGHASYAGIHWVATQVWRSGVPNTLPAAMAVTVDFLPSGSVVFSDGVNAISARWSPLSGDAVRLGEVASSAAGYVGHDAAQLAAIVAVQEMTSPPDAGQQSPSDITVTRTGDTLTLARAGVRISYRNAGMTAPEMTRSAAPTTRMPNSSSAPRSATTSAAGGDKGTTTGYNLLTHCGIREALIRNHYYVALPILDDGNGNPPKGWSNPYDSGTMTINADRTADFRDTAGHRAHFVMRPAATTWLQTCA